MLHAIFDLDNPVMRFLSYIADLIILNLIFLVTCIPIVTIGAAWSALSYMTLKQVEGYDGYMLQGYLKAFKSNFKQGTLLWLIVLAILVIFAGDMFIIQYAVIEGISFMKIPILVLGIIAGSIILYIFPLNARFSNTIKGTLKNAMLMAIGFFPRTFAMVAVVAVAVVGTTFNTKIMMNGILFWILLGFALVASINARIISPVFAKFIPKDETEKKDPDEWIMEE